MVRGLAAVFDLAELMILWTGDKIDEAERFVVASLPPDSFERLGSNAKLCSLLKLAFLVIKWFPFVVADGCRRD